MPTEESLYEEFNAASQKDDQNRKKKGDGILSIQGTNLKPQI